MKVGANAVFAAFWQMKFLTKYEEIKGGGLPPLPKKLA